jgi:predicted AAA+ superfamily ATPase
VVGDSRNNSQIAIEVSYGPNKDTSQVRTTMQKLLAKYGLVVSQHELAIEENVVFIPHKFFFLL